MAERKPVESANCKFHESWWNDPEQRNYVLHSCNNKENTGGRAGSPWSDDRHGARTYSCWHENEGMKYRCWGNSKKISQCTMATMEVKPEVACERFPGGEEAHPSKALVTKLELREEIHQSDGLCLTCQNCIEVEA